jgi:hypothetical protein
MKGKPTQTIDELTGPAPDAIYDAHDELWGLAEQPWPDPEEVRSLGQRLQALADELPSSDLSFDNPVVTLESARPERAFLVRTLFVPPVHVMLSAVPTSNALAQLRGVRLGKRERGILLAASPPASWSVLRSPRHRSRSDKMAWQRAARRLRDLGLIELEQHKRYGQLLQRTKLGQKVVERYREQLDLDLPIRWPSEKPRRRQRENVVPLRAHIKELCAEQGIARSFSGRRGHGSAYLHDDTREIRYSQIHSRNEYFTALHEIGHILLGHRGGPSHDPDERLQRERDAWDWALENARVKPTQAVRGMILRSLRSYGAD